MKKPNPITACLVIYNEEKVLERCLQSLNGYVSEIIIVHDGKCKDNSLKIASKFTKKIYSRPHKGMCEAHKVWLFNKVKTEWILQIDADEYLSPELQKNLSSFTTNPTIDCYQFLWRYWDGNKFLTKRWPYKPALFRKDKINYLGFPHETIRVKFGKCERVNFELYHKPLYANLSLNSLKTKWTRWIKIHTRYLLMDYQKVDRIPKNARLSPHYQVISKHPLLSLFIIPPYHLIASLYSGAIFEGLFGIRYSVLISIYYFLLIINVIKIKGLKSL